MIDCIIKNHKQVDLKNKHPADSRI